MKQIKTERMEGATVGQQTKREIGQVGKWREQGEKRGLEIISEVAREEGEKGGVKEWTGE